jgi:hypothetical protein
VLPKKEQRVFGIMVSFLIFLNFLYLRLAGYRYVRAKDIYWRCSEKDCRTTAQLFTNQDGTGLIKGKLGVQPHNHAPQHDKQETEQRRNRFYYSTITRQHAKFIIFAVP